MSIEKQKEIVMKKSSKWIVQNLDKFDQNNKYYTDQKFKLKVFVELVFVMNPIIRRNRMNDKRLFKIIDFIKETTYKTDFQSLIRRDLSGLAGAAIIEEFKMLTEQNNQTDLKPIIESQFINLFNKSPFRILDLKYSLNRIDVFPKLPSSKELYKQTTLAKEQPIHTLTNMELYSMTHVLFYLTDMVHNSIKEILDNEEIEEIKRKIVVSLYLSVKKGNIDILGELLICLSFLSNCFDEASDLKEMYEISWEKIVNSQHRKGFIPPFKNTNLVSSNQDEFELNYHSTTVALGASLL